MPRAGWDQNISISVQADADPSPPLTELEFGGAHRWRPAARTHWLTGDFGSSSNAMMWRIWSSFSSLAWPKRGMFEHAA